jgi:D-alanine transaminase
MRSHLPPTGLQPTCFAYAVACGDLDSLREPGTIAVSVQPDQRWQRCEIKSISLMGAVLPMLEAASQQAEEAVLVRDGVLSEGSSSNILIVRNGVLATPPIDDDPSILHGTVREAALQAARDLGLQVQERRVHQDELRAADEVLVASSRRIVASVTRIDDTPFGGGAPGPVACRLLDRMRQDLRTQIAAAKAR